MSVKPLIRAISVGKDFNRGAVSALSNVSVDLHENQITAFVGPSGCGKTTMLRMIAGLDYPTRGSITIEGNTILGPGPERGMIFQAYTSFPWLTARKNVEYGLKVLGVDKQQRRDRAMEFLKLVRDHPRFPAGVGGPSGSL